MTTGLFFDIFNLICWSLGSLILLGIATAGVMGMIALVRAEREL